MERHDLLYRLYDDFDTQTLREYQQFVDVLPPVDSAVVLDHWQQATDELEERTEAIERAFAAGETFAEVARVADRDQAFTALDLLVKYGRAVNVLVLDVDETLRSAGGTDNEIPRETLHLLTEFVESGVPIVICTGQTLENVKGAMIQGLGSELVHSGDLSVVYEAGTGVFTPDHGADTKRLLYDGLDEDVRDVFTAIRSRVLSSADQRLQRECHLQGNEFNVTMKPNFEIGSDRAADVIDRALVHQVDLLGEVVVEQLVDDEASGDDADDDGEDGDAGDEGGDADEGTADAASDDVGDGPRWARTYYADQDPEIRDVLSDRDALPRGEGPLADAPGAVIDAFERIDVAYYEADAAEVGSLELNKVVGVESAFDVLGIDDPFALVVGDSKSDLRVMEWVAENDAGIAAAPDHASTDTLAHVVDTEGLVFDRGDSADILRTAYALNRLAELDR